MDFRAEGPGCFPLVELRAALRTTRGSRPQIKLTTTSNVAPEQDTGNSCLALNLRSGA